VETREQADFFKERGCQEVQGYYFSRPMPPEQLAAKLALEQQLRPAGPQSC
jgi:EAL domain-containing protein (putative c-di-GMP-specific phosphodiesterase class I)